MTKRFAIKTPPQHGDWADFAEVWRAADQIDLFESAWTMDHFYPLTEPMDGSILESWTMLGALAQMTSRIRLGCMVNGMHFRHPAVTANMAATVDIISEGRFDLGLGAGWFEPEAEAYGIPLGTIKERLDRFEEGVEVVDSLLRNEFTNFSGAYYELKEARCEPKPVQAPRPLKVIAKFGDMWDMTFPDSPAHWKELDDVLVGHCGDVGRDPGEITRSIHLGFPGDPDYRAMADQSLPFFEAGVDVVIYSMRGPYKASMVEALAKQLASC